MSSTITPAPTSITAFVGYTAFAINGKNSLLNIPFAVNSMAEFEQYFGKAPLKTFAITTASSPDSGDFIFDGASYALNQNAGFYYLHSSMRYFFANGGSACYVISVGTFDSSVNKAVLQNGIDQLINTTEPALLVVPDAMALSGEDAYSIQEYMLDHCGRVRSRFALLDIYEGWDSPDAAENFSSVTNFRTNVSSDSQEFGAAYFPWMNTSIVTSSEITYLNISNADLLVTILTSETNFLSSGGSFDQQELQSRMGFINMISSGTTDPVSLDNNLRSFSLIYTTIMSEVMSKLNLLPPSAAVAGICTAVDATDGVWKAPANVSLNATRSPATLITDSTQANLNISPDGKSVNAIRTMLSSGITVWGARTLMSNNSDYMYVNVQRTMIMIEQSIKTGLNTFVFSPNDSQTWSQANAMISGFLNSMWEQGGLVGPTPASSFSIAIGLGTTMTADDILNGLMIMSVQVAVVHPAEFIVLTFEQQVQTS